MKAFVCRIWDEKVQGSMFYCPDPIPIPLAWMRILQDPEAYIFMLSTGLKDTNGKLIYDGDLIKLAGHNELQQVKWSVCCWVLRPAHYRLDCKYEKRVVGNIYEDKGLWKLPTKSALK